MIKKGIAIFLAISIFTVSCSESHVRESNIQQTKLRDSDPAIDCNNPNSKQGETIENTALDIVDDFGIVDIKNLDGKIIESYAKDKKIDLGGISGIEILQTIGDLYTLSTKELQNKMLKDDRLSKFAQNILLEATTSGENLCDLVEQVLANDKIDKAEKDMLLSALASAEKVYNSIQADSNQDQKNGSADYGTGAMMTIGWGVALYFVAGGTGFILGAVLGLTSWLLGGMGKN